MSGKKTGLLTWHFWLIKPGTLTRYAAMLKKTLILLFFCLACMCFSGKALAAKEEDILPSPELSVLRQLKKDLLFLHAHYEIREK